VVRVYELVTEIERGKRRQGGEIFRGRDKKNHRLYSGRGGNSNREAIIAGKR